MFSRINSTMKQYCYVIVSTNGTKHWTRIIAGSEPNMESNWEKENLQHLLANGWRPVRETAMGGSGSLPSAFSLLVLERDTATASPAVEPGAPGKA
jgi:hypothetical protein